MHRRLLAMAAVVVAAGTVAAVGLSSAPPVGPLPKGPVQTVKRSPGRTFTVTLPRPGVGRSWRVARSYDSRVVREVGEGRKSSGAVWASYRAIAPGTTRVVYALTRGETSVAYASHTFRVVVSRSSAASGCPSNLLALSANPISPAVTTALVADQTKNRPQVTAAAIASHDTVRGPQVKFECGSRVQARTVIVYITDRALLPSESASQRVLFVGRTGSGYRVWKRAH